MDALDVSHIKKSRCYLEFSGTSFDVSHLETAPEFWICFPLPQRSCEALQDPPVQGNVQGRDPVEHWEKDI